MIDIHDKLYKDFETVRQIPIIPTMLEVICRTTGMGFAAVARVTDDRWLACNVRDEINFGLAEGGELKIETTICNEIRDNLKAVIINHVDEDNHYLNHHTPKTYGFQSYISFPIILKNGDFFGTLCAIDPKPAQLNNPKIIGMFSLFVELLSFHLQSVELMEMSHFALKETKRRLVYSQDENLQYQQISNHNLKEPLRKISVFSDILVNKTNKGEIERAKQIALKINSFAQELTKMIQELTEFAGLSSEMSFFEIVDLNQILLDVCVQLSTKLKDKKISVKYEMLPKISAIPSQIEQLFFHLINNIATFSKRNIPSTITIYAKEIGAVDEKHHLASGNKPKYFEIVVEDNEVEIEEYTIDKIFDFFINFDTSQTSGSYMAGLAHCRKIVHNHGGVLKAKSIPGRGTSFFIILPSDKN